ncbi:uncharacterized protein LOC131288670 [Anopheles ziemanni]|uniref:uncharacterized protein LOC131272302 n=1 Tax=Anopheles coustani TaxID=139045 RepID=UPI00265AE60D|nr:uncharacterized protein LOC131272302 [Anopheles coustani]XP_058173812.1 uncharacterized protein LOC131288670 [Anopheles ziemanni]
MDPQLGILLKEQRQLKATEGTLKSMIEKINHQLNQLLVEELQLKSRDVQLTVDKQQTTNAPAPENATSSNVSEINRQELNLEIKGQTLMKSLEESEDEL